MNQRVTKLDAKQYAATEMSVEQRTGLLELAESVARLGHWQIDLNAGKLYWSDEVYRIHGVSRDDYFPDLESAIDFYHPDDAARVSSFVDSAISEKRPFEFESRLVRRDGSERVVVSRALVQLDQNEQVVSVFGVLQDVTDERETQRALQERIARMDLAMRGSRVGLWDWDVPRDIMVLSSRGEEVLGMPASGSARAFFDSIVSHDQDKFSAALELHFEHREPMDVECRISPSGREVKWIRVCGQALWSDDGAVIRMAGSLQDISEQKRHQALREAIGDLGSAEGLTSNDRVRALLAQGCRFLGLDSAFVARVEPHVARIELAVSQTDRYQVGTAMSVNERAIAQSLTARDLLTDKDPLLQIFAPDDVAGPAKAGDMIGAPLRIRHQEFGVVVFASSTSGARIFGETARSVVRVLSQIIGYELSCGD